jgi:hypothetical protein
MTRPSNWMTPRRRKGLGPRGIGSKRGVCLRAVLDTNCFWGSPQAELEAIRSRGFSLSISHEALREAWARSLREDKKALLQQRIALISPHLDPEHPIAFTGRLLLTMIGRASPELHAEDQRAREFLRRGWDHTRTGLTDERWRSVGKELDDEIEREADGWEVALNGMRHLRQRTLDFAKVVGHDWYPRRRAERLIEKKLNGPVLLDPPAPQRLHLLKRLVARKTVGAREQQPQRNDYVDWRLLVHLAWPAFLVTSDFRLIRALDETGSLQRAWVRAPVELIQDPIYRCEPWGKPGRWVKSRFRRQDLKTLRIRQDEMRRRFEGIAQPRPTGSGDPHE